MLAARARGPFPGTYQTGVIRSPASCWRACALPACRTSALAFLHGAEVRKSGRQAGTRPKGCPRASPRRPSAREVAAQHNSCAQDSSQPPSLGRRNFSTTLQTFRQAAATLPGCVLASSCATGTAMLAQSSSAAPHLSRERVLEAPKRTLARSSPSVPGIAPRSCDAVLSSRRTRHFAVLRCVAASSCD